MSSFERRGLPFRDVFDSSFDAIVHVDYLDLEKTKRLLRRRAIGVPVSILAFCHCMAAGLPRDLIRTCRALFDLREEQEQANAGANQLAALSSYSIRSHLKAKLLAVSVAANLGMGKPDVDPLFEMVHELELMLDSSNDLFDKRSNLLKSHDDLLSYSATLTQANQGLPNEEKAEEVVNRYEEVAWLRSELAAYLYYSVALLEFFGQKNFDRATFMRAEQTSTLDRLVRARQFIGVSPSMATSEITELRNLHPT